MTGLSVEELSEALSRMEISERARPIVEPILVEIGSRLDFLREVALDYLALNRSANTLSGGEAQRIRLASQIGAGLVGVMYILDEPSIGLHQSDNLRLIDTLKKLRDRGNTVLVVEHDEETIESADHIVDVGPVAGLNGGQIIAQGTLDDIISVPDSITGRFLSGKEYIEVPTSRRTPFPDRQLIIHGARFNNLKNLNVEIPLGMFVTIAGVSGSGKSSLAFDTLYAEGQRRYVESLSSYARQFLGQMKKPDCDSIEGLSPAISIDQKQGSHNPRSTVSTVTEIMDYLRLLYVSYTHLTLPTIHLV